MTRKIKVKTLEEKAKDNLIKTAPANQEKTPVDYVIPDENETSVEPETTQAGKTLTPINDVMAPSVDMEYVKKLLANGVPIVDYVDTTKPYEPNLPEPDLFINEENQEAREAVSSKDDTMDKLAKSKKIVREIMNKIQSEKPDNSNQTPTKDSFEQIISKAKNMDDRICKVYNQDIPDSNENNNSYENVNHPNHYNNYDVEVIDMMERIWGPEKTAIFCELNAFKYRMRMGTKPTSPISEDLEKEIWYLNKMKALKNQILKSKL